MARNPLASAVHALVRSCEDRVAELKRDDESGMEPWEWIPKNRWILGAPWGWDTPGPKMMLGDQDEPPDRLLRPYLKQYINDSCSLRSASKSRQSEFTEAAINGQLALCLTIPGFKAQHVFPIAELAREASGEKIQPAILESPRIKNRTRSMAVHSNKFKNGSTYVIIGSLSKTAGRTTSKDLIAYDEYDFLAAIEAVMDQQISHSKYKIKWRFSTPTAPNVGIDRVVQDGCEFIWEWVCEHCRAEQRWSYPDNIINWFEPSSQGFDARSPEYRDKLKKAYFGCSRCGGYCDRNSDFHAAHGRWVPTHQAMVGIHNSYRQVAGMIPWKTGMEILAQSHELLDYPTQFQNEVWGSAHVGGENRLQAGDLLRCVRSWRMFQTRTPQMRHVSIGIDVEKREVWIVVRSRGVDRNTDLPCIVAFWRITERTIDEWGLKQHPSSWAEATCRVCERYDAERIVIDANGLGTRDFDYLLNRFPQKDRVWGAFFDTAEKQRTLRKSKLLVPLWNQGKKQVTFSEVNELRKIQGEVKRGQVGIPAMTSESAEILKIASKHFAGTAIQPRWDSEKEQEFEIAVRVQQDNHLLCADMYARIGEVGLAGHGTDSGVRAVIGGRVIQ